jgi:hypothetical protein
MYSLARKKSLWFVSFFIFVSLACDMSGMPRTPASSTPLPTEAGMLSTSSPTFLPATLVPDPATATLQPTFTGVEVSVDPLRIVLSPQVASGARGLQLPRAEGEVAPWEITPGHIQLKLEGYAIQNTVHEAQIYAYPAQAYAEMYPPAFESMHRLNNILYDPSAPVDNNGLPGVPFFNAAQVFASNIQVIPFENGRGVRFLTEYAQYPASVNNHDLFYQFQGLTADGYYYIVAILPIRLPALAETSDAGAVLPAGGVPYPYFANPEADMQAYYSAISDVLNTASPDVFTPTISQLDSLIQSIRVAP